MRSVAIALVLGAILAAPRAAAAQTTPPSSSRTDIGDKSGKSLSVRGHVIIWGSGGLDLDVVGDVTAGAIGTIRGTQMLVSGTAFPDVYVRTQRRRSLGVGIGVFDTVELFGRYSDTNNPAAAVIIGQFGSSSNTFGVSFDNYKERALEFGLRKYLGASTHSREYLALLGGVKTVQPISMSMQAPGGSVQTALYGRSHIPTYGIDFGITVEFGHVGIFTEGGFRYQRKLVRDDSDLARYSLEDANNTGIRLYMPVSVGLLLRF